MPAGRGCQPSEEPLNPSEHLSFLSKHLSLTVPLSRGLASGPGSAANFQKPLLEPLPFCGTDLRRSCVSWAREAGERRDWPSLSFGIFVTLKSQEMNPSIFASSQLLRKEQECMWEVWGSPTPKNEVDPVTKCFGEEAVK